MKKLYLCSYLLEHSYVMTMCDYMTCYTRCIMTTISISINQLKIHKSFESIKKQRLSIQGKSH